MDDYWNGKAAVVTGGARGQGASIARMLLAAGAHVHVMDRLAPTEPVWGVLRDFAATQPGTLFCHEADIAHESAWLAVAQHIEAQGRPLYALVNNAGITGPRNTVTHTVLSDWEQVMGVNVTGATLGIRTLAPRMPAGGSIVSIASTAGMTGYYSAAYSTSKWALRGLTKSAALELAPLGVRANCICPGVVDTDMIRNNAALFQALQGITPLGKMAQPDQIADVMFFLLGPKAAYITGADIAVDGGVTGGGIFWPVGRWAGRSGRCRRLWRHRTKEQRNGAWRLPGAVEVGNVRTGHQPKEIEMGVFKRVAGFALVAGMAALAQSAWAQQTLKVGALNPYSGPLALYGTEVTRGYELATDKINAAGGVLGKKIELIRGDVTNAQQGIATVEQLVSRDKVDMFVGTYISGISLTASDTAMRYNKLYWETNAVAQALTERRLPNFIRSGPDGGAFANTSSAAVRDLIAPALKKDMKDLKIWIEHEESIYGTSIAQGQKRILEAFGAKVVGVGAHASNTISLNDTVLRAKKAEPDILIQTGYVPDGNLLLRTAREQGFKPAAILFVGTGDTPETLQALGNEYMNGILVVGYPRNDITDKFGPGNKAYLEAYRAKYKSEPVAPQGMAAYSGFLILAEALKAAGSVDPAKVQAATAKLNVPENTYPSGFGAKFDDVFQNVRAQFTASQWQDGKLVTVFPKEAVLPGVKLRPLARP